MKSRDTLIRLKKFQLDEKRRRVVQIEAMIADFQRMASELDREIASEQERAGIHDPAHFAYPTYAKAAMVRRENLKRSAEELAVQLDDAKVRFRRASRISRRSNCSTSATRFAIASPAKRASRRIPILSSLRSRTAIA